MKKVLIQLLLTSLCLLSTTSWAAERVTYYHNDLLGSPVAATDINGAVVWREEYKPYGERQLKQPASQDNTQWYTGKTHDESMGLSYFGARWYNPELGRFTGIDPVGVDENNPHSFNRYTYANNNPYKYTDPDGNSPVHAIKFAVDLGVNLALNKATTGGYGVGSALKESFLGLLNPAKSLSNLNKLRKLGGATKSAKPTLSTLHTGGTKIPGGRKIGDTLAGSNKIKNANGDTFKRVDFAPSKPHNGLSPHTHPNFRNQLPDSSVRSGVSRNAGPVKRRDIIDAARQGSQRTGGQ